MNALEQLRRMAAEQNRDRLPLIGAGATAVWLALVGLGAALAPDDQAQGFAAWLVWLLGVTLPVALIWFAVWCGRAVSALRSEAEGLRSLVDHLKSGALTGDDVPRTPPGPIAPAGGSVTPRQAPARPQQTARTSPDPQQNQLELDTPDAPELTPTEVYFALNFPDGPEDREAIRCLRLALADPHLARLIRAAQDVITLLAGQGVYMDDVTVPETDAGLWLRFSQGARGQAVSGLAVISDQAALDIAGGMMRGDEVFRDVAHHFLRHFDRLLARRAEIDDANVLAVLSETRSGRAFILLAQVTGMLGNTPDASADAADA